MPNGFEGFAALGDLVAGGPTRRAEKNYTKYLGESADTGYKLERASRERANRLAADMSTESRGKITPELVQRGMGGDQAALAELGAASLRMASGQPNMRALGDLSDQGIDAQRQAALSSGDIPQYNRLTALRKDMAYQPARVVSGNVLPDGLTLGDEGFQMQPLPQTAAAIEQKNILGDAATLRANAYSTKQSAPPNARQNTIATRAATMEENLAFISKELGRALTPGERVDYLQGRPIKLVPASAIPALGDKPAAMPSKYPRPSEQAVKALWNDPALFDQFAAKYGPVAARSAFEAKH